jgi:hypothetical protein
MPTSRDFTMQELMVFIDEFESSSPSEIAAIVNRHQDLGVRDILSEAAARYNEFWDLLGCIKVLESFEQLDKDSASFNSALGADHFPLESKPYLNQQSVAQKAFMAWHLHNTQKGLNEAVFTPDQCRAFLDRMRQSADGSLGKDWE